jgi:DNA polymerase (family 10)
LLEIAGLYSFEGKKRFQANAYEQGARIVIGLGNALGSAIEENRLGQIEGIGPSLSRQIQELWQHGESSLLRKLRAEHPRGAAELLQIEGMTPRRIRVLSAELGVGSAEELRAACESGRVRTVKGFGKATEHRLEQAALKWLHRMPVVDDPRLLRAKGLALAQEIIDRVLTAGGASRAEVVGPLRRGEEIVTELAIVFLGDRETVYDALALVPKIIRIDRDTAVARLINGIVLHIHVADASNYGDVLLRATGTEAHLHALKARAAERRTPLRAHTTESDAYEALELAYIPPELRNDGSEIADAQVNSFDDLIAASDLRGAVHCHTTYSDGRNSVEEMALAAQAAGLEYITITDHSQSAAYASGLNLDQLKRQWDEIDQVQERVSVRIFKGIECDILQDGALDFENPALDRLEIVIASIHKRFAMDANAMTERLVRAMSWPFFKVWGHPLGRILLHRDPIACDLPAVLDALRTSRGAIELSADPHRLDLPSEWIPLVHERRIPFVISVDAHSTRGLQAAHHGVTLARRGRVKRNQVLNTLPSPEFAAAVSPRASTALQNARASQAFW